MAIKRLTPLITVALVALATVGVASALWSKTLTVDGTIATGDLDAGWTFASCSDFEMKDVGHVMVPEADVLGEVALLETIGFQVTDAYPGYRADCQLEYTYTGSVPAHVEEIIFDPGGLTACGVFQQTTGTFVAECEEMTITWVDGLCSQLHAGDFVAGSLRVDIKQAAEQATEYDFDLGVLLVQYNESACPG
jgi:hypothetical protein